MSETAFPAASSSVASKRVKELVPTMIVVALDVLNSLVFKIVDVDIFLTKASSDRTPCSLSPRDFL